MCSDGRSGLRCEKRKAKRKRLHFKAQLANDICFAYRQCP